MSEVAVGEFLEVAAFKDLAVSPDDLLREIKDKKIIVCRLNKRQLGRYTDLVNKIRSKITKSRKDRQIDATDIQILACSMVDKECKGLLTFDGPLINSKTLETLIKEHIQDRRYVVTDYPFKNSS